MSPLAHLFMLLELPFWSSLVTGLLHTLWIGALLALVAVGVLRSVATRHPELRHAVCLVALAATLFGGFVAWGVAAYQSSDESGREMVGVSSMEAASVAPAPGAPSQSAAGEAVFAGNQPPTGQSARAAESSSASRDAGISWSAPLALLWLAGVLLMLVRFMLTVAGAQALRRAGRPALVDSPLARLIEALAPALGITRRVSILLVDRLVSPCVVGVLRPALLFPATWAGIPEWQLRAILAHELAHIARHDYLVNLAQMLVEALLSFNPAVWWLSRQARIEREAACDARAARVLGEGGPLAVAQALAAAADALRGPVPLPAAALALGTSRRRGLLAERVRRLLDPVHRPAPRLPLVSLVLVLAFAALALACMKQAGDLIAHAVLSHEERIEQAEELREWAGEGSFDLGLDDEINRQSVTIVGEIRTWDGQPVPRGVRMKIESRTPRHTAGKGISPIGARGTTIRDDGSISFSYSSYIGNLHIGLTAPGYAPVFAGPFRGDRDTTVSIGTLVLGEGFTARVRVTDPAGAPLAGVKVQATSEHPSQAWRASATSDEAGILTFEHATTMPLRLAVRHAGFEEDQFKGLQLSPDDLPGWRLTPAAPTTGVVVDQRTGKPLEGVEFRIYGMSGSVGWNGARHAPLLATSDAEGRFVLDTLRGDSRYMLFADSPAGARQLLRGVGAGERDLHVEMPPPLTLSAWMPKHESMQGRLGDGYYNQSIRVEHFTEESHETFKIEDHGTTVGFTITHLMPGPIEITALGISRRLNIQEPIEGLRFDEVEWAGEQLDLAEAEARLREEYPLRPVVIRLVTPKGAPPPTGHLDVKRTIYKPSRGTGRDVERYLKPMRLPVGPDLTLRFEVQTPNELELNAKGLNGYWFPSQREEDGQFKQTGGKVPPGEQPFEITVPLQPAGGIRGTIHERDGSPASRMFIGLVASDLPNGLNQQSIGLNQQSIGYSASHGDDSSRFAAAPLPLVGSYWIVAGRGHTWIISDRIRLSKRRPFVDLELRLPETVELNVHVSDKTGRPLSGAEVSFTLEGPGHSFGSGSVFTDGRGVVSLAAVTPRLPDRWQYMLEVQAEDHVGQRLELGREVGEPVRVELKRGRVLEGRLLDLEGRPLAGAKVDAQGKQGGMYYSVEADGLTDEQGRFRLTRLDPEVRYTIGAQVGSPNYSPPRLEPGSEPAELTLRLAPAAWWLEQNPQPWAGQQ